MKVRRGMAHAWFTQNGTIVKATCEPSVEEKLVVVALDATEQALTPGKKLAMEWFGAEGQPKPAIGRYDRRES